jgi:hypothetical protein
MAIDFLFSHKTVSDQSLQYLFHKTQTLSYGCTALELAHGESREKRATVAA